MIDWKIYHVIRFSSLSFNFLSFFFFVFILMQCINMKMLSSMSLCRLILFCYFFFLSSFFFFLKSFLPCLQKFYSGITTRFNVQIFGNYSICFTMNVDRNVIFDRNSNACIAIVNKWMQQGADTVLDFSMWHNMTFRDPIHHNPNTTRLVHEYTSTDTEI